MPQLFLTATGAHHPSTAELWWRFSRSSRTAEEVPELVELDLNPILVTSAGVVVVDCKARLAPRHAGPGPLFRSFSSPERD